ncbi:MAG: hypothetical protein KatS3mg057_0749 [Herpetosiphonaceae bacterium]|nr:MAG: hypothetical protein KatS3mg057_0749 [Herpetosiphonaceae bacterium]
MNAQTMNSSICPECEGVLHLPADLMEGEIVPCGDCGAELEVLSLTPAGAGPCS